MTRPGDPAETVLQGYLGPEPGEDPREGGPSAALLSAFLAGELPPGEARNSVARYLETRPELAAAIESALEIESAESAEDPEDLTHSRVLTLANLRSASRIAPLNLSAPTMALAAADDEPPIPKDRQQLISDKGLSLVYFRRLAEGWLLLSGATLRERLVRLHTCSVGSRACAISDEAEGQVAKLGPLATLAGQRLTVTIDARGEAFEASWDLRVDGHDAPKTGPEGRPR